MKKILKPVFLILSMIILVSLLYLSNPPTLKAAEENLDNINPIQNYKDTDAYVNGVVENFFQIYSNLVSNKEIELSYLSDVVDKNSSAFEKIKNDIITLREICSSMDITILQLKSTAVNENHYKIEVLLDKVSTDKAGVINKEKVTVEIDLTKDYGYRIIAYTLK